MIWLIILGAVLASAAALALWVLPWMRRQTDGWARRFLDWIEPYEIKLWGKSESKFFSFTLQLTGIVTFVIDMLVRLMDFLSDLDPNMLAPLVPKYAEYVGPSLYAIGLVSKMLRDRTSRPPELVAVPNSAPLEVQVAVQEAAAANTAAVVMVQAAKDSGALPK